MSLCSEHPVEKELRTAFIFILRLEMAFRTLLSPPLFSNSNPVRWARLRVFEGLRSPWKPPWLRWGFHFLKISSSQKKRTGGELKIQQLRRTVKRPKPSIHKVETRT